MLLDDAGRLAGIFTDSDLARLLETRRDASLDGPVSHVMTQSVQRIQSGTLLMKAIEILASRRISELPVVDAQGCPIGLLDITDVISLEAATPLTAVEKNHQAFGLRRGA